MESLSTSIPLELSQTLAEAAPTDHSGNVVDEEPASGGAVL